MATDPAFPYSVLVLTKNEELNIGDCLGSVPAGVDTYVLDSMSTDRTAEIAESSDAEIHFRPFDNYAAQRNYGLQKISYRNGWVLMLDADERMTTALHEEILSKLAEVGAHDTLFRMRRKDIFMGRWLRRSSGYPTWFGRLARIDAARVEREINEEFVTEGRIRYLDEHLIHYPFNKGISYWIERHNRYSTMEAATLLYETRTRIPWLELLRRDPAIRRKWLKQIAYRLPFRSLMIFLYLYIFRGGLLDGRAGFNFCKLRLVYEFMIDAKIDELKGLRARKH